MTLGAPAGLGGSQGCCVLSAAVEAQQEARVASDRGPLRCVSGREAQSIGTRARRSTEALPARLLGEDAGGRGVTVGSHFDVHLHATVSDVRSRR